MTLIAFILSLSTHVTMTLLASLTAFLAALLTLIAFAVDIALYAFVKHEMGKLNGVSTNTDTAPGECSVGPSIVSFLVLPGALRVPNVACLVHHSRALRSLSQLASPGAFEGRPL